MKLEFKVYELKETSKMYDQIINKDCPNEFIIVGEELFEKELECFKVHQIEKNGIKLVKGLTITDIAFIVDKKDLKLKNDKISCEIQKLELDIPKNYLTLEIIEKIQRLNN